MSAPPRPSKLTFKGDTKTKKKKRKHHSDDDGGGGNAKHDDNAAPDTWVLPEAENEIRGPTFLFHPSEPPICITYDAHRRKIMLVPLLKKLLADDADVDADGEKGKNLQKDSTLLSHVPTETSQVWVTTRVAGSTTINLRTGSAEGKFLSCDRHGLVSADREARGAQEEWTPVVLDGNMVAFQNVYEKYLAVDEVAGGGLSLRGDSENIGFAERFWCKVQSKYKKEAHEEERKKNLKEGEELKRRRIDEVGSNHTFQAWGAGRSVVSHEDTRELKKARTEGRLSEALLDRRAKLKSDRFC